MTEETFLIIFLLPSFREIPRSTWDMGEPWSFYEQLWLLKCFRDSMVRGEVSTWRMWGKEWYQQSEWG